MKNTKFLSMILSLTMIITIVCNVFTVSACEEITQEVWTEVEKGEQSDYLPLNETSAQLAIDNEYVTRVKYGTSAQGRTLEAYIIKNGNTDNPKTLFMDFAFHGFEDEFYRDGQVLVEEANKLIDYFAKHPKELKSYRLVVVPCANPDGVIAGKNNKRSGDTAFGRCTSEHIDMNRDFKAFKAVESRKLRDFINSCKPDIYLNIHGWLDESIGNKSLNKIICSKLSLSKSVDNYPTQEGYSVSWVNNKFKIPCALVEYKSSSAVSLQKDINMIKAIVSANITEVAPAKFPTPVTWKNGSTKEKVYKLNNFTQQYDTLKPKKQAKCYGKKGSAYVISYTISGGKHRAGFVKYSGGIKSVPTASKTYKNGKTTEAVYSDTAKKKKIGSLSPNEKCACLGKIDSMYLVVYKVTGTKNYKCGFVAYNGGC